VRCSPALPAFSHHRVYVIDIPVRDRPGDTGAGVVVIADVYRQPGAAHLEHRQLRLHLHRVGTQQGPVPRDASLEIGHEVENIDHRPDLLAHRICLSGKG
jgi:hypothetical protein